jgi:hypothetical protein
MGFISFGARAESLVELCACKDGLRSVPSLNDRVRKSDIFRRSCANSPSELALFSGMFFAVFGRMAGTVQIGAWLVCIGSIRVSVR